MESSHDFDVFFKCQIASPFCFLKKATMAAVKRHFDTEEFDQALPLVTEVQPNTW